MKKPRGLLYVGHLPKELDEVYLRKYFEQFGVVNCVHMPKSAKVCGTSNRLAITKATALSNSPVLRRQKSQLVQWTSTLSTEGSCMSSIARLPGGYA